MSRSEHAIRWRKSSYSSGEQGECLEVADGYADIPVRDSKNPTGPALRFQPTNWASFIESLKVESLQA
ncbi:DUF397 domain-containing protein [Streptomyces sp. NPDC059479]|uniref:DUF397 domain-containing protein n=1 Tax=Streptomyces sp. NPDC059479 TaxID=3346848 RepID=UPI003684DE0A